MIKRKRDPEWMLAMFVDIAMGIADEAGPQCQPAMHAWFKDCYRMPDDDRQALVDLAISTRADEIRTGLEELGLKARPGGINGFSRGSWRLKCLGHGHYTLSGIRTPDGGSVSVNLTRRDLQCAKTVWNLVSVSLASEGHREPHETEWYRIWFGYENWKTEQSGSPLLQSLKATETTTVERDRSTGLLFDLLITALESEVSDASL